MPLPRPRRRLALPVAILALAVMVIGAVYLSTRSEVRWIYCDIYGMSLDGVLVTPRPDARETEPGSGCWEHDGPVDS